MNRQPCWAVAALLVMTSCSSGLVSGVPQAVVGVSGAPSRSTSAVESVPMTRLSPRSGRGTGPVKKLLTIVEENHSIDEMKTQMRYLFGLAQRFAYTDHYSAITHPSLPNYLAIAGGDTFGVVDDNVPAAHIIHGQSIFGQALTAGMTAKTYEESMDGRCVTTGNTDKGYAVKHNPWAYFVDERVACDAFDVSTATFLTDATTNQLPTVGILIPNKCHDAHDVDLGCNLGDADNYLTTVLPTVLASSDFRTGGLAVVVTADEGNTDPGGSGSDRILTVVMHADLDGSHGVVDTPLTHYSLSRLYSQVVGVPPLREAAAASDMAKAFDLPLN